MHPKSDTISVVSRGGSSYFEKGVPIISPHFIALIVKKNGGSDLRNPGFATSQVGSLTNKMEFSFFHS